MSEQYPPTRPVEHSHTGGTRPVWPPLEAAGARPTAVAPAYDALAPARPGPLMGPKVDDVHDETPAL